MINFSFLLDQNVCMAAEEGPLCNCYTKSVKKKKVHFGSVITLHVPLFLHSTSVVGSESPRPSAERRVCGYQQWLKSEPGGYALRERNSITGKWPVIETIPGIPKPTLHQCCSWHKFAFHYYCLLLWMLMSRHGTWQYGVRGQYGASSNI